MVSTSIPTLSIAAISSAKAQTHTEYYNDEHGKIAKVDAKQDSSLSPRAEPPRATRSPPRAASAGVRPAGGPLPTTQPPAGRSGTSGGCCCCSRRSTRAWTKWDKIERSCGEATVRRSECGEVPTLAGGLRVDSREVPCARMPRATPARMRTSCRCTTKIRTHDTVRWACGRRVGGERGAREQLTRLAVAAVPSPGSKRSTHLWPLHCRERSSSARRSRRRQRRRPHRSAKIFVGLNVGYADMVSAVCAAEAWGAHIVGENAIVNRNWH